VEELYPQNVNDRGVGEVEEGPPEHVILHVFLTQLYQKFQTVLNGHIFLIDFVRILTEYTEEKFHCYTKRDVASCIQNEVKALLYDYLTGDESVSNHSVPVLAITEMLKDTKKVKNRPNRQIFHLKNKPDENLRKKYDEACPPTKESLRSAELLRSLNQDTFIYGIADKFTNVIESGHKLLVTPSSSNILVSFKPTIEFMRSLERSIKMRLANFRVFLDDFIFNVYLPQIQEQVLMYYHSNVNGIDAFQADRNPDARYPLIKSALCMILAMHGLCRTLRCMPVHSDELMRFLESILRKYYERCRSRFRGLLLADANADPAELDQNSVLCVQWAVDADIAEVLRDNTYLNGKTINLEKNRSLCQKETFLELSKKGERSFHRLELILEPRKLEHMGNLLYGIRWLNDQIEFLRGKAQQVDVSQSYIASHSKEIMRAFSNLSEDSGLKIKLDSENHIDLPLTEELEQYT
jgi:exocyst complex component 4